MVNHMNQLTKLAYSIEELAEASAVGRTNIYAALKAGELQTVQPIVAGKRLKRRLIPVAVAEQWISGFPLSEVPKNGN